MKENAPETRPTTLPAAATDTPFAVKYGHIKGYAEYHRDFQKFGIYWSEATSVENDYKTPPNS